jgi:hypothetical protein
MSNIQPGDKVIDKTGAINNRFPVQVTKIDGDIVTVEYYQGSKAVHKVETIDVNNIEKS